jgi:type IV secretory pathway VirB2 component (pilin)
MPWESVLTRFTASLLGPVALGLIIIGVFSFGFGLLFAKNENHKERAITIGLGATICGSAATIASLFA